MVRGSTKLRRRRPPGNERIPQTPEIPLQSNSKISATQFRLCPLTPMITSPLAEPAVCGVGTPPANGSVVGRKGRGSECYGPLANAPRRRLQSMQSQHDAKPCARMKTTGHALRLPEQHSAGRFGSPEQDRSVVLLTALSLPASWQHPVVVLDVFERGVVCR
jgi:hypothetical protein